ncbi:glycosyltransferase family 4 protein [Candidatus Gracilibacteria bacterium]|nr:glycosyltransferase family 4 protein [Candidatus Gracilibacteria bacterium]
MKKILFITQKRDDAIGTTSLAIVNELKNHKHNFDFLEIGEKGNAKIFQLYNYVKNTVIILIKSIGYSKVYIAWENPYVVFLKLFFPWKKIYMCVHHIEVYWDKFFIPNIILGSVFHFIAISNFTKQQLLDHGVKESNISINYNGINKLFYPEKIENFTDYTYILYVGTEVSRKNTDTLLEVFSLIHKKYPELKLVKIGKSGDIEAEKKFNKKVKELEIEKSVIINRDFISPNELRKWYSNALCYISLSTLEGFGLTIPEAIACGCPIIASNIKPFEEICQESEVLFDPYNKENIVKQIEKYIQNDEYRGNIIKKLQKNITIFTWKYHAENLIKIIK